MTVHTSRSPFHEGEHAMQEKVGKRDVVAKYANKLIRTYMPDQHREFFQRLPFVIIGSVDQSGFPWASVVTGKPGFIRSPSPTTLTIDKRILNTLSNNSDPLVTTLEQEGAAVGLLGIELQTRRRNRMNARIKHEHNQIVFRVDQSFGNCPKYIQTRHLSFIREPNTQGNQHAIFSFKELDNTANQLIDSANTFFVSSYVEPKDHPNIEGVDVSHRGGIPGFVKRKGNTLTIPDYSGNNLFNTLGNFLLNPKAGIVFPNFSSGDLLMLTGSVEILEKDHPEVSAFKGAQRAWRFKILKGQWQKDVLPFHNTLKANSTMNDS